MLIQMSLFLPYGILYSRILYDVLVMPSVVPVSCDCFFVWNQRKQSWFLWPWRFQEHLSDNIPQLRFVCYFPWLGWAYDFCKEDRHKCPPRCVTCRVCGTSRAFHARLGHRLDFAKHCALLKGARHRSTRGLQICAPPPSREGEYTFSSRRHDLGFGNCGLKEG
jgi:hypothetical protein